VVVVLKHWTAAACPESMAVRSYAHVFAPVKTPELLNVFIVW